LPAIAHSTHEQLIALGLPDMAKAVEKHRAAPDLTTLILRATNDHAAFANLPPHRRRRRRWSSARSNTARVVKARTGSEYHEEVNKLEILT
jgi:uncharacterized protein YejL (UPF0352 family)